MSVFGSIDFCWVISLINEFVTLSIKTLFLVSLVIWVPARALIWKLKKKRAVVLSNSGFLIVSGFDLTILFSWARQTP